MTTAQKRRIDRNEVRDLLETQRRELTTDLELRVARLREQVSRPIQPNELEESDDADVDVSLLEIAAMTLQRIDAAIRRLDNGRYGLCARCNRRIAGPRLRAMPFAVHCRDCETTRERETGAGSRMLRNQPWRVTGRGSGDELDAS